METETEKKESEVDETGELLMFQLAMSSHLLFSRNSSPLHTDFITCIAAGIREKVSFYFLLKVY